MFTVDYLRQELRFYEGPVRETTMWGALAGMRGAGEGDMIRCTQTRQEPLRQEWQALVDTLRSGHGASRYRRRCNRGALDRSLARSLAPTCE